MAYDPTSKRAPRGSATPGRFLTTACERKGGYVLPADTTVKGGALKKVLGSMLTRGLVQEVPAAGKQQVWRTDEEGTPLMLKVTKAAYEAVGTKQRKGRVAPAAKGGPKQRGDSKQAKVIAMLKRTTGATVEEIMAETEWQAHTVRGFFAGALKKRLGLEVTSEKVKDRGRVYRRVG
jgi:hypothetical protein